MIIHICLIRSIVPQELVFIKTYPFGMIKLIKLSFFYFRLFFFNEVLGNFAVIKQMSFMPDRRF